ncbi:hypothetical protein [Actinacidiphila sp. ITFR-21]|uniref:hypothetical protein n=1 Tax=Actinacidiphila sp. ITFR-21 TaxID=3075199 RepID=UPI00288BF85C|nr:hypothetical protein [Streptomyces sp. ITFR-21]WNI15918.1 hypothetical protein RLT57_10570 [Streptomyces sp. ITFR-21]
MAHSTGRGMVPARRGEPLQRLLFGGVYGTVLSSALAAALDHDSGAPDSGYDALWILVAVVASAAAHGYAHAIAHRTADGREAALEAVRSVLTEWPLVAAAVPTLAALVGASAGWWSEEGGINAALAVNTVALFGWGLWAGRTAGQSWATACRVGAVDVLLGLFIVVVNVVSH